MGRLHTCYAPVRRSPSNQASLINAAPRLACVKPIASVHPEPGSNSSLLYFLASFAFLSSLTVSFFPFPYTTFRCFIFSKISCAPTSNEISFFSIRAFAFVFLVETDCKVMYFFWTDKIFSQKFFILFFSVPFWPYSHNCSQLRMQRYCYFWYLQIISILFLNYFLFAWFDATYNITLPF